MNCYNCKSNNIEPKLYFDLKNDYYLDAKDKGDRKIDMEMICKNCAIDFILKYQFSDKCTLCNFYKPNVNSVIMNEENIVTNCWLPQGAYKILNKDVPKSCYICYECFSDLEKEIVAKNGKIDYESS